jgi:phosphoribosylformimino-5-aminoimidazole carboxamide ribotide isomerase
MDVIPVIDVQHGIAVRAISGRRAAYRPLQTPLAAGSDPVAVALGLVSLFAFPRLYVADLDGIEGRRRNAELPGRLAAALPGMDLWVDDGASPSDAAGRLHSGAAGTPVVGSESLKSAEDVTSLRALPADSYVLSLDFKDDRFDGPAAVLEEATRWPQRVIVMTLARVGSGKGPDLKRIAEIVERSGSRRVYAAGGVRHAADVEALRAAGAAGVLAATALHAGTITAGDLEMIAGR